jgi:two-component system, chemotaxis family, CheB/CheR fusion protein
MCLVVVVHLDPKHRSELVSIIAARTHMPVIEIGTRQHLEANHVYVIPPDRRLQMVDHEISALEFDEPRGQRAPIDLFFRSLAEKLGDGFAVILSGAGSDGTTGVRAVKEAGGIILVQEPNEAEYSSMPRSAIATGVADFILPVRDLAKRLMSARTGCGAFSRASAIITASGKRFAIPSCLPCTTCLRIRRSRMSI